MLLSYAKWYARIVGIFFLLIVFSLFADLLQFGFRLESVHKILHILLGGVVVWQWNNEKFWKPFAFCNGVFFLVVATIGWLYPDLGGLDAFNQLDTLLHTIVGVTGVLIAIFSKQKL